MNCNNLYEAIKEKQGFAVEEKGNKNLLGIFDTEIDATRFAVEIEKRSPEVKTSLRTIYGKEKEYLIKKALKYKFNQNETSLQSLSKIVGTGLITLAGAAYLGLASPNQALGQEITPRAHQQSTSVAKWDDSFINFVKQIENSGKDGFRNGRWYPHESPEGGLMTIGYGHKIKSQSEQDRLIRSGMSESDVEKLLIKDLEIAYNIAGSHIRSRFGVEIDTLNTQQKEMLTEFVFNLGGLGSFPKFTKAVIDGDVEGARREYRRTYIKKVKDPRTGRQTNVRTELTRRNTMFYDRYLKNPKWP